MTDFWVWWVAAALLVGLELVTGTFYLLAVGIAFAIGGVVAWMGAAVPVQLFVGAALSVVAVTVAHQWRKKHGTPATPPPLDRGQTVHVDEWNADGSARVVYRGTHWNAVLASADVARAETLYIVDTRGSTLVLSDRRP
jgi:membrane protein implicated in regulation of membrane protease activity